VRSAVPTEVFAGRLAEAEAQLLKGAEPVSSAPADREQDGNAGAPEPKKTSAEYGSHSKWASRLDEFDGQPEAHREMIAEGFQPEGLCVIVAPVKDIQAVFLR
jgi:hypothetical protein